MAGLTHVNLTPDARRVTDEAALRFEAKAHPELGAQCTRAGCAS